MNTTLSAAHLGEAERGELSKLSQIAELPKVKEVLTFLSNAADGDVLYTVPAKPLSTTEAADLLGVSRSFVNKLIREGDLDCAMVGSHKRIPHSAITQFMAERETARKLFAEARSNHSKNENAALNELMDLM
ncbi:helix-turn-helix domain-containing protein [Corynebacterium cystitidis]|uniref:DNA binding domain-containing protein, excisionase family n=1 Tax=Corynebacterium cystitidis DSM 20524 TaxID=1121357 RepID=A0A1H9TB51_9CORY|nr:helix-turn-helix domain-containing protein [Corynebacterium cystitidis]WJY83541.1 Helix-turn-helix domain protein [Corynebacterium cystitidis DSM 20524]SER94485.1 DNA binding domain-containing protein, excisionase family [Corynebacterium cystitidis DSM 20524]SNV92208.1 putative excisionase [Corynebacterium cystitidis]